MFFLCSHTEQNEASKADLFLPVLKTSAVRWLHGSWGLLQRGGRSSALSHSAGEPHNRHCFYLLFLDYLYLLEAVTVVDFPSVLLRNKHAAKYLISFGRCNRSLRSSVQISKICKGLKKLLKLTKKMNSYSNTAALILQQ